MTLRHALPLDQRQIYRICYGLPGRNSTEVTVGRCFRLRPFSERTLGTGKRRSDSRAIKASQTSEGSLPNSRR